MTKNHLTYRAAILTGIAAYTLNVAVGEPTPQPSESYFGTAQVADEQNQTYEIDVRANGPVLRYDLPADLLEEANPMAMVLNYDQGTMLMFPVGDSVPADERMAMSFTFTPGQNGQAFDPTVPEQGIPIGSATYAGEACTIYEVSSMTETGEISQQRACLTSGGILLHAQNQVEETASFEMINLVRGAQPAALFAVPAGYEVMDMSMFTGGMGDEGMNPIGSIIDGAMQEAEDQSEREARREVRGLVRGLFGN
ncbi:MAG: hypothetical protein AAFR51_18200 [Pseudomonadota bacterium]